MTATAAESAKAILTVDPGHQRMRLDQYLAGALQPEYSRSRIARLIKAGLVKLNGAAATPSATIRPFDRIEVLAPPAAPFSAPESASETSLEIEILFEDRELIVVNKPAGMVVHHAAGHPHSTLVDALLARYPDLAAMESPGTDAPGAQRRPGIVHRLDKDTSGVMVVARTPFARASLSHQFNARTVRKLYLAIVRGVVARDRITIARAVGRHPTERKRMSVRSRNPRAAVSHLSVLSRFDDSTLMGVRPETGRTHQIRVHLASIGHPCVGDKLYGRAEPEGAVIGRQALHALALEIDHPRRGERLSFEAPVAADLVRYLEPRLTESLPRLIERWRKSCEHE